MVPSTKVILGGVPRCGLLVRWSVCKVGLALCIGMCTHMHTSSLPPIATTTRAWHVLDALF